MLPPVLGPGTVELFLGPCLLADGSLSCPSQANCTCIGIWRPERGMILPHPCVFLNPPPEMQIEPGDHFFLVGPPISEFAAFEMFGPSVGQ